MAILPPDIKPQFGANHPEMAGKPEVGAELRKANYSVASRGELLSALSEQQAQTLVGIASRQDGKNAIELSSGIFIQLENRGQANSLFLSRTLPGGESETYAFLNGQFMLFGGPCGVISMNPMSREVLPEAWSKRRADGQKFLQLLPDALDAAQKEIIRLEAQLMSPKERLQIGRDAWKSLIPLGHELTDNPAIGLMVRRDGSLLNPVLPPRGAFALQELRSRNTIFSFNYDAEGKFISCDEYKIVPDKDVCEFVASSREIAAEVGGDLLFKAVRLKRGSPVRD